MARADLVVGLVRAAREQDEVALRRIVEALIADERDKHHHLVAERLEEALRRNGTSLIEHAAIEPGAGVEAAVPRIALTDLVLPEIVRATCDEIIEEQSRSEVLRSHGLEPRHRVLLTGPPGNGKTSVAEGIAEALMLPFMRVRYEAVIGSHLGETATRLARVFEFARSRRCVLFLDEFDAIAKERGDEHETGEIKRVVTSLLMFVDEAPSHVVLVAASNHPELLDRAAHRRFEAHLWLPQPDASQRIAWFERFLAEFGERPGVSPQILSKRTAGASFSQLEDLVIDIRRRRVLDPTVGVRSLINARLQRWRADLQLRDA